MKRLALLIVAGLGFVAMAPPEGEAIGGRRCYHEDHSPPCEYVEQTVTRYRPKWVEQEVTDVVYRRVPRQEEFTYNVRVPVMKPETRTVTVYQNVEKEVPYTYTVSVPVTTEEKRTITVQRPVQKEVPYTYMVSVPVRGEEKRTITVQRQVQKEVPYEYTVSVPVQSEEK